MCSYSENNIVRREDSSEVFQENAFWMLGIKPTSPSKPSSVNHSQSGMRDCKVPLVDIQPNIASVQLTFHLLHKIHNHLTNCSPLCFSKLTLIFVLSYKLPISNSPKIQSSLPTELPCLPHPFFCSFISHFHPCLSHQHLKSFKFLLCFCLQSADTKSNIGQKLSHIQTRRKKNPTIFTQSNCSY